MSKKKKSDAGVSGNDVPTAQNSSTSTTKSNTPSQTPKLRLKDDTQSSLLTITRNKHWRYISAFHGPWLQLPHEILETLTHSNYLSPRPRQTDPSVLYDLLKIRQLVDEAADLAVRAQNGTASSALSNSQNAGNGLPGSSLGLSYRGVGANAKLSPERRYRMREMATQKLALAYRLDEVAASVATMQSASALDNIASLVLQRAPENTDAKYVHFFHEKIPSRMMAEYTPLTPLNEVIAYEPGHAAPFRTRALTKIFKEDHVGAIQDLTEALALCRLDQAKQKAGRSQLVTMKDAMGHSEKRTSSTREWIEEKKVASEEQPSGLEMQLLFQRGNQYLTVACKYIQIALASFEVAEVAKASRLGKTEPACATSAEMEAYQRGLEAREALRKNAKRALRDYTAFFSQLDYAYTTTQFTDEDTYNPAGSGPKTNGSASQQRVTELDDDEGNVSQHNSHSTALTCADLNQHLSTKSRNGWSPPSPLSHPTAHHEISTILSASPPPGLPPFPPSSATSLMLSSPHTSPLPAQHTEFLTYHPFLPEALHAFLLTHCLLQTAPTTLHRLALNVARLTRLADGYPFFLAARSPARADWAEILRKTNNWISLPGSWETLCTPVAEEDIASRPAANGSAIPKDAGVMVKTKVAGDSPPSPPQLRKQQEEDLKARRKERIRKEAVMEALGDERVVDDASFQRAVEARESRALQDLELDERCKANGGIAGPETKLNGASGTAVNGNGEKSAGVKKNGTTATTAAAKDAEFSIGTERAEGIAKWILQAPVGVEGAAGGAGARKGKRKPKKAPVRNDI